MKSKILITGSLCLFFCVNARVKAAVQPLHIGDIVPDILLSNVLNHSRGTVRLSEFHNKLLILNFWSTTCGSCIGHFPEEVRLQKKYKDKLQFLLVDSRNTRDTKQRVTRFFEAYHPSYKALLSIVEDTLLSQYFPHQTVGYYVWIINNRVITMADEQDITENNIELFFAGHQQVFSQIKDIPYDQEKPIFLNGNGGDAPNYISRSILTPYHPGLHSSSRQMLKDDRSCFGYSFINLSKLSLYMYCHPEIQLVEKNRFIFDVEYPEEFSTDSTSLSWNQKNLFIYEATFPSISMVLALKRMRNDLDSYFHLKIDSIVKDTACYVITLKDPKRQNTSGPPLKYVNFRDESFLRDVPLSVPIGWLNSKSKIPFVDDSNYLGTIRMTNSLDDLTVDQILEKLKEKGFVVRSARRTLKFFVFSNKPPTDQQY